MSPRDELSALLHAARRALDLGRPDTARAALEDARRLGGDLPEVQALARRLEEGNAPGSAASTEGAPVDWEAGPLLPPPGAGTPTPPDDEDDVDWFGTGPADGGTVAPEAPALTLLLAEADPPGRARPAGGAGAAPPKAAGLMRQARALFDRGDFTGSLARVEQALEAAPGDPEAVEYLHLNEATLIQMYESKLGPLDRIPRLAVDPDEVAWLNLDHRAGFVLAQIDGTVSWEDLFALSGMSRLDTCRVLCELIEEGVVVAA